MTRRDGKSGLPAAFTLVELLAAVMVMTVLVLILLPAFRSMQSAGLRQRAAAQAAEMAQAVLDYRRAYGAWPLEDEIRRTDDTALVVAGEDVGEERRHLELAPVINLLRGLTRDGEIADAPVKENPRDLVFLELPSSSLASGEDGEREDGPRKEKKGTPLDPWGRPYVLVLSRQDPEGGTAVKVGRIEGGVRALVETRPGEKFYVDSPDDAVAFSWGDPDMATNAAMPTRVVGSWSKRR